MAVDTEKAISEGSGSAGALVAPKYGVGDKCPECGMPLARLPSGEIACKNCGYGQKKAVGFMLEATETKETQWEVKEISRDGVKGLYIEGYASTWMEDRDQDTVARNAFDHSLKAYLEDNPVLLKDHDREKVLGSVLKGQTDEIGLKVGAFVPKPETGEEPWKFTTYNDIKRGLRRAFSMGGVFHRKAAKGLSRIIERVDLFEISNVAVPSNPKSLFRVVAEKGLHWEGEKAADEEGDASSTEDTAANRRAWAKAGYALSDGSFPVLKCGSGFGSVRSAVTSMGRGDASNSRLKAHITKNAERLGCTDELPEEWGGKTVMPAEWKAAGESEEENGNALKHTHAKVGGGTLTHQHDDAKPGHSHEGLLPMPKGKTWSADEMEAAYKAAAEFAAKAKGNEQALIDYWTEQMGGGSGESGDFEDCVSALSKHDDIDDPQALCAWIHMQATGAPPGHASGEEDKAYPVVDEKGEPGTPRLHVHVPVGGKGPRRLGMVHSHVLNAEADGHRHEGYRPYRHPKQEAILKMGTEVETKGAAATDETEDKSKGGDDAKTVTLSAEQFKEMQEAVKGFQDFKRQREVEETAEHIAENKMKEQEEAQRKAAAEHDAFVNDVAKAVEAKLAGHRISPRKYVTPPSSRSSVLERKSEDEDESMISLLYQKAQGDPEARLKLKDMSSKAAAEMGVKALVEGTTSGYLVPPQYMQQGIAEYRIAAAKVRQLCTTIGGIGTNLVYIPRETGIATVGWTAEGAPKPSTDQTFGQLAVNIFTLAGISKVSNQLLEDSNPAVDQIVRKDLGRLLGQAEDIAFITGTGAGQPTGILNTAGILTGAIGGATIADAIASGIAAIQANYYGDPEAIVMNPKHLNTLRTAKDANNRYIFEPAFFPANSPAMRAFMENNGGGGPNGNLGGGYSNYPSQGGPQGTVWGLPVFADANVPTPTNAGNIIVGAFSEAYVLERTGVTIDVSSEAGTSFEQNQTWFRGEERLGFTAARQPTAFYAITGLP